MACCRSLLRWSPRPTGPYGNLAAGAGPWQLPSFHSKMTWLCRKGSALEIFRNIRVDKTPKSSMSYRASPLAERLCQKPWIYSSSRFALRLWLLYVHQPPA